MLLALGLESFGDHTDPLFNTFCQVQFILNNCNYPGGGALTEAEGWADEKVTLSAEDREFLAASRAQQREEEISVREQEAELARERTALSAYTFQQA